MRDIKFRGWNEVKEKMLNWNELLDTNLKNIFTMQKKDTGIILMQYTGLKDKNGKQIYEGDIVKVHYIGGNGVENDKVIFYRGTFCVDYSEDYKPLLNEINHCCEVIGNIYDNSDLLEKEG